MCCRMETKLRREPIRGKQLRYEAEQKLGLFYPNTHVHMLRCLRAPPMARGYKRLSSSRAVCSAMRRGAESEISPDPGKSPLRGCFCSANCLLDCLCWGSVDRSKGARFFDLDISRPCLDTADNTSPKSKRSPNTASQYI